MVAIDDFRQKILEYIETERAAMPDGWPEFKGVAGDGFCQFHWCAPGYPPGVGLTISADDEFPPTITFVLLKRDTYFDGHLPLVPGALAMLVGWLLDNQPVEVSDDGEQFSGLLDPAIQEQVDIHVEAIRRDLDRG